ncbi:TIGR01777 family oxidoreductase [Neobacillus niacini]|uniref:TIGR01777 family oxidoreductase n=1 Tax=Neobacillus niacini TaxID=86668 RepID=UPI00052F979A|nr:TIGR01777 family oxidoreductase [Neobacillus niacini]KGM45642.1 multidrug MFS transporter [Neobacillus niacini]MEC1525492.1 TIGR01777 family oxidoreductase [Neobacillus niacini]
MKIVIAGGSGFIGKKLTDMLLAEGHSIVILTRKNLEQDGKVEYVRWLDKGTSPEKEIRTADAFINLAGVSINDGRWSKTHQKQIYDSRMTATDEILRIISVLPEKPAVLINASAIGIYPASVKTAYTEESSDRADDFLGKTVHDWENKAKQVEEYAVRAVFMRFGVVLGKEGGALPLMALPYRLFVGGKVGSGEQWVSWVHVLDVVRAIVFALNTEELRGPVNVTSPSPLQMNDFGKTIGSVLHRPHWIPVPAFAMKLVLGKKSALVLEGQHVIPKVLQESGFTFTFPTLRSALVDLLTHY